MRNCNLMREVRVGRRVTKKKRRQGMQCYSSVRAVGAEDSMDCVSFGCDLNREGSRAEQQQRSRSRVESIREGS
jgi:hypothetical protein